MSELEKIQADYKQLIADLNKVMQIANEKTKTIDERLIRLEQSLEKAGQELNEHEELICKLLSR